MKEGRLSSDLLERYGISENNAVGKVLWHSLNDPKNKKQKLETLQETLFFTMFSVVFFIMLGFYNNNFRFYGRPACFLDNNFWFVFSICY